MLHKVPPSLSPIVATLFNPLGAGVRWGVTLPGTSKGDIVVVLGPGIRGISAVIAAKSAGCAFVLITGKGAFDKERLDLALQFGADAAVDVDQDDPGDVLMEATGKQADIVIDVTARAPAVLAQAGKDPQRRGWWA